MSHTLPTAGFRNETEFLGADAIVRFDGGLGLPSLWPGGRARPRSAFEHDQSTRTFVRHESECTGDRRWVSRFLQPGLKGPHVNDFESHELRFEYAPRLSADGNARCVSLGLR